MASLRFNYNGDKRPERGRTPMNPYMTRNLGYPVYGYPMPFPMFGRYEAPYIVPAPEANEEIAESNDIKTELEVEDGFQEQEILKDGEASNQKEDQENINEGQENIKEEKETEVEQIETAIPEEPQVSAKTASEKLLGKLEVVGTGLTSTREHLNKTKIFVDEVIYKMESFQQIMDILKANEERKTAGVSALTASSKTTHDSIDDFLELLQTPALQNILRQLLLGIMR